jgi:hypothetical protein
MTIVPWIPNLAKIVCAPWALTFYFHCAIFQLNAQIAHGAGLSRSLVVFGYPFLCSCGLLFQKIIFLLDITIKVATGLKLCIFSTLSLLHHLHSTMTLRGRRDRDHIVFRFTTTYAMGAYHQ